MALTEQEEFELLSLEREKAMGSGQQEQPAQQNVQPQQQGMLQRLLQAEMGMIKTVAGGIVQPPIKLIGQAGQSIESALSGKEPIGYNVPLPDILGGNVPIEPPQSYAQAAGPALQTASLALGPIAGGAAYGAGMGMENQESGGQIAGKAVLGGLLGGVVTGKLQSGLKKIFKFDNVLKQAEQSKVAIDGVRSTLGKAKELAMQDIKDLPVDFSWKDIPEKALTILQKPDSKVLFDQEGKIVNTVGNLDRIKVLLQDMPSQKDFVEAGKLATGDIIRYAGKVRDAIVSTANKAGRPELGKALSDYHEFMNNYNLINDHLVDKYGNAMANKLKSTFRLTAEPAVKEAWKKVAVDSPELKGIIRSRKNRELLKTLLVTAPTVESGKRMITGKW